MTPRLRRLLRHGPNHRGSNLPRKFRGRPYMEPVNSDEAEPHERLVDHLVGAD